MSDEPSSGAWVSWCAALRRKMRQMLSWPLVLALCFSLLLHLLVISEADWTDWLPDDTPVETVLQARLLPPPVNQPLPAEAAAQRQTPASKPAVRKAAPRPQPVMPAESAAVAEPGPEPEVSQPVEPPAPEVVTEPERAEDAEATDNEVASDDWDTAERSIASDAEPVPAYQQVSTEFSVYVNGGNSPSGKASIVFNQSADGGYHLLWVVEGRGLLKLLYPTLKQESRGTVGPRGLQPQFYRYAFGNRADKIHEASFDWAGGQLTLKTAKGEQTHALPANTQDLLSFMYQFMFVPPLDEMQVTLTNGRRLGDYEYEFEGEETLVLAEQTLQTLHIAHTRGETDEKIELWLATEYRYLPVKIRKIEKSGMVIEQVATRLIAE